MREFLIHTYTITNLSTCRMDAYCIIKVSFGGTKFDSYSKTLSDLSGIWSQNMEANNFFLK